MLATEGLDEVFHLFSQELGLGKDADYLKALFSNAYLSHTTLTEATRYLVNELLEPMDWLLLMAMIRHLNVCLFLT